jgi:hypothetical protein
MEPTRTRDAVVLAVLYTLSAVLLLFAVFKLWTG